MDFHGNIELQDNEMQRMVLQMETDFPVTPKEGRIVFKGSRVWICVEIQANILAWVPLMSASNTYIHDQFIASDVWTIVHDLNSTTPIVQVFDVDMNQIIPDEIVPLDANQLEVYLNTAAVGRAVVMFGNRLAVIDQSAAPA